MAGNKEFVAGVGNVNIDLIYSSLERLPNIGEEVYSSDFSIEFGGGVPATLINVLRLGIDTRLITHLGDDMFSKFGESYLKDMDLCPINIYDGSDIPVNVSAVAVCNGDRSFLSFGHEHVFTDTELESVYSICSGAKVILMEKNDSLLSVYKRLKENGSIMVFDCGWDDEMNIERYIDYLNIADYYTPNRKEALKITGESDIKSAANVLSKYFDNVVIKLDKDGVLGKSKDVFYHIKAANNKECIDATGAGDAFLAGFIYGLFYDRDFEECIRYGKITGEKCITGIGCLREYMTRDSLESAFRDEK